MTTDRNTRPQAVEEQDEEATKMGTSTGGQGPLEGAVIAVAGAAGPAGRATLLRLAEAGAVVVGSTLTPSGWRRPWTRRATPTAAPR